MPSNGMPSERSFLLTHTLQDLLVEIQRVYKAYDRPWVVGYSGGKDSTTTLQLVWQALAALPPAERTNKVFVISSDTQVETPVIVEHVDRTLRLIDEAAQRLDMPFLPVKVIPELDDSFWVNLIGRGYPAPTSRFRWCTERLKIKPANRFISEKVAQYGEVIMVLGVRRTESATRMQLMSTYEVQGQLLRRHSSLSGAYVYAPIAEFSTADVWTYLLQTPSPWGASNRDLAALYKSAGGGECPLVIDTSTPSCGSSRFGCWVCTVATRDSSMEAMIESGEGWMEPLLAFREWLAETTNPERKHEYRDVRGRDGRVLVKKDGQLAARTYKLDVSKRMLEQLLRMDQELSQTVPGGSLRLISEDELLEIRRIWRTERDDWEDSVAEIVSRVRATPWAPPSDDFWGLGAHEKRLLQTLCAEKGLPFSLLAKLLEQERRTLGMARRSSIHKSIEHILGQDWRSDEELRGGEASQRQEEAP